MTPGVSAPAREAALQDRSLNAERLLRTLGATGKLVGFRYAIFMVEKVMESPDYLKLVSKGLYPLTGRRFGVSGASVERALRMVVQACWKDGDHSVLEEVAGAPLTHIPSNIEFIDILAGYLRWTGE